MAANYRDLKSCCEVPHASQDLTRDLWVLATDDIDHGNRASSHRVDIIDICQDSASSSQKWVQFYQGGNDPLGSKEEVTIAIGNCGGIVSVEDSGIQGVLIILAHNSTDGSLLSKLFGTAQVLHQT